MRWIARMTAGAVPASVALALAVVVPTAPASGQEARSVTNAAAEVTAAELRAFAATHAEVAGVIEEWRPRIDAAQSAEQAHELNQQASREVLQTIENGKLSSERYNAIYTLMHRNPDVADRIRGHLREIGQ